MIPFLILFLYLSLVPSFTSSLVNEEKKRKWQAILCGIGVWALLALRSIDCGRDLYEFYQGYIGYIPSFHDISNDSLKNILSLSWSGTNYEVGYRLYNWLVGNIISKDPHVFLAITAAIEIFLLGYTFLKKSPDIVLSYFVFACFGLYVFSFSGLRQALALSMTFFSYNFFDRQKPWMAVSIILFATTFHTSALLFLPALFLRNMTMSRKKALSSLFLIVTVLVPFVMTVLQYGARLLYGHEKYTDDNGGSFGLLILYILIFVISVGSISSNNNDNKALSRVQWFILCAILLQSTGIFSAGAFARVAYYYSVFFTLLLPLSFKKQRNKQLYRTLTILLLIAYFIFTTSTGYLDVVPYQFWWEDNYKF